MREIVQQLNESKLLLGILFVLMNIGSKYVFQDVPPVVHRFLQRDAIKAIVLFSILYVSIRDIEIAIFITLVCIILFGHLLNHESDFCIVPKHMIELDLNKDGKLNEAELNKAQKKLDKYKAKLVHPAAAPDNDDTPILI